MLQEKLQFLFLSMEGTPWTKINPQKPKQCGLPEHSLGAGGTREEWRKLQKASKTVLNRNSNCSSPPHFSLALGKSHQQSHYNCFQHIQLSLCCMTESVPEKQQCSRQKSFSPADLYQYRICCLLYGKHSKRNQEHDQTETLA